MKQEISTLIYATLKGIVEIYPVLADVEDSKNLPVPYAIYQLKESGNKTKETVKKVYDTGIFIVTDTYEIAWEIIHKVEEAINLLDRSSTVSYTHLTLPTKLSMMERTGVMLVK